MVGRRASNPSVYFAVSQLGQVTCEKSRHGSPTAVTSATSVVQICRFGTHRNRARAGVIMSFKLNLSSLLAEH
jgi:hypothetical protein